MFFGDYTQDRRKRRLVKQGDDYWMICYYIDALGEHPHSKGRSLDEWVAGLANREHLALAVKSDASGNVQLTLIGSTCHLIRYTEAQFVEPQDGEKGCRVVVDTQEEE